MSLFSGVGRCQLFQSSLEGNPEWNWSSPKRLGSVPFQSSLEGNPEWNGLGLGFAAHLALVSILTRGKPRVERKSWRETEGRDVSILTRGKPRVEPESARAA